MKIELVIIWDFGLVQKSDYPVEKCKNTVKTVARSEETYHDL